MRNEQTEDEPAALGEYLGALRVVLVGTVYPGNIGAAARAMKTMGLRRLCLVAPQQFPHREAEYMAVSARDLVDAAECFDSLAEAVADCSLVIGASARGRRIQWPVKTPRECAESLVQRHRAERVALVFGREDRGLENDELQLCNWHLCIPSSPVYPSLNLAAAVQLVCYELRQAALAQDWPEALQAPSWDEPLATAEGLAQFYQHLEQTLIELEFLDPAVPRQLMTRLRRLFGRTEMDQMELNILRGVLAQMQKKMRH